MTHRLIASLLAFPLLAACAPEVRTSVTASALQRVAVTGETGEAAALLRIPQPSFAQCTDNLPDLAERLASFAPVGGPRCVAQGLDTFAEVATPIALTPFDDRPEHHLAAIVVSPASDGSAVLGFRLLQSYEGIFYTLAAGIAPRPSLEPTAFTVILRNDGAEPLTVLPGGQVVLDGRPNADKTPLASGATAELRFTPVAAGLIESGTDYTFGQLFMLR